MHGGGILGPPASPTLPPPLSRTLSGGVAQTSSTCTHHPGWGQGCPPLTNRDGQRKAPIEGGSPRHPTHRGPTWEGPKPSGNINFLLTVQIWKLDQSWYKTIEPLGVSASVSIRHSLTAGWARSRGPTKERSSRRPWLQELRADPLPEDSRYFPSLEETLQETRPCHLHKASPGAARPAVLPGGRWPGEEPHSPS